MCDNLKVFSNTIGSIAFKTRSISALLNVLDFITKAKYFSPSFSVANSSIVLVVIRKKAYLGFEDYNIAVENDVGLVGVVIVSYHQPAFREIAVLESHATLEMGLLLDVHGFFLHFPKKFQETSRV
jgi:hypothetical protein